MRLSLCVLSLSFGLVGPACIFQDDCDTGVCPSSSSPAPVESVTDTEPTTGGGTGSTGGTSGASEGSATSTMSSTSSTSSATSGSSTDTGGGQGEASKYGEACAPDDGPAVEFQIGLDVRACTGVFPEDAPLFRIVLFQGVDLPLGEHVLDGGLGFAYLDKGDGMPVTGMVGNITVTAKTSDGLLGTYDVTLDDDTHLSGTLDALYCPQDVLCG